MSSSDSDDDIGPGGAYYYSYRYQMNDAFCALVGLDSRFRYERRRLYRAVIDYATAHNGIKNYMIQYDDALWNLFGLPADKTFKTKRIERYMEKLRFILRPCPICEKPRLFKSYYPNGLCKECCEPYKDIYKPKYVSLMDFTDSFFTAIDTTPSRPPEEIVIQGVLCRPTYSDEPILEAIVHCPICKQKVKDEVKEERRLGAFCEMCSRSEDIKDADGNRVRCKPLSYWDKQEEGFVVLHYKNGEIIKRHHVGEFHCFFRGVPIVAEDTGIHDNIIVRFRDKASEQQIWEHIRLPEQIKPIEQLSVEPTDNDWLNHAYPRWAQC